MIVKFKNIKFFNHNFKYIFNRISKGGVLVAPAASALANIDKNKIYYSALVKSDIAIFDSGFFCILLRIFKKIKVKKLSGYKFLKLFLNKKILKNAKILLINPNIIDQGANTRLLKQLKINNFINYLAPKYNLRNIKDTKLIQLIKKKRPDFIIINLGGGIQEPLGIYIKKKINYKAGIICTGAAIAFMTKRQAPINDIVDKLYMGWLIRNLYTPKISTPRTFNSFRLIKYFFNY